MEVTAYCTRARPPLKRRRAVVEHYNQVFGLNLSEQDKQNLVQYLRSL